MKRLGLYFLIPLVIQAIALVAVVNLFPDYPESTDFQKAYYPLADSLLKGEGYKIDGRYNFQYPPGYPLIVIFFMLLSRVTNIKLILLIRIVNVVLLSLSVYILYKLGKEIFGDRVASLGAYLWAIFPFSIWLTRSGYTFIPFIIFMLLALLYLMRFTDRFSYYHPILIGLFAGISTIIRPIAMLWFIIPIIFILTINGLRVRSRIISVTLVVVFFILVLFPWESYVYMKSGEVVIVSKEGWTSIVFGITFATESSDLSDKMPIPDDILDFMTRTYQLDRSLRPMGEKLAQPHNLFPYLLGEIVKNPLLFLKLIFFKLTRAWYGTQEMWYEKQILFFQIPIFITFILGVVVSYKYMPEIHYKMNILLLHIIYFWIMTTIALSILRLMVPAMPVVVLFSSVFIVFIFRRKDIIYNWKTVSE